ncbi:helix-turn-helix domain-containing protein [Humibacter ginsenosidimutans]|nr:helix-turn-helix domain-containing protein [Humibacter ginsenosidimutans]
MDTDTPSSAYLTPGEATKLLPVGTKTLSRLAETGQIRFIRLGERGHRRYLREDVEKIAGRAS